MKNYCEQLTRLQRETEIESVLPFQQFQMYCDEFGTVKVEF